MVSAPRSWTVLGLAIVARHAAKIARKPTRRRAVTMSITGCTSCEWSTTRQQALRGKRYALDGGGAMSRVMILVVVFSVLTFQPQHASAQQATALFKTAY